MSARDEIITYLGLPAGSTFSEIEHAYVARCNSVGERLAAGDESARVELEALKRAFGQLTGRTLEQIEGSIGAGGAPISADAIGAMHARAPAWWESYLSLLLALGSAAALGVLIAYLPHVYRKGGFMISLALIASSLLLSIFATMLAEGDVRQGRRIRLLQNRGMYVGGSARLRFNAAHIATFLSRGVRWLLVPAFIVMVFLNFASLSGRWSLRK